MSAALLLLRGRERENELRTDVRRGDDVDIFLVGLDDLADDGEPEAGAFLVLAAGLVDLIETRPDLGQILLVDADAVVPHGHEDLFTDKMGNDIDRTVVSRKLDGVVDEVVEYLSDAVAVRVDRNGLGFEGHVKTEILLLNTSFECR